MSLPECKQYCQELPPAPPPPLKFPDIWPVLIQTCSGNSNPSIIIINREYQCFCFRSLKALTGMQV